MTRDCENFSSSFGSGCVAAIIQQLCIPLRRSEKGGNRLSQQSAMNNCERPLKLIDYRQGGSVFPGQCSHRHLATMIFCHADAEQALEFCSSDHFMTLTSEAR